MQSKEFYRHLVKVQLIREHTSAKKIAITDPQHVVDLFRNQLGAADREEMWLVLLDACNGLIGIHQVSMGTVDACLLHPREVFKAAILANACGLILCHNHPSGSVEPSSTDIETTHNLVEAGKLFGIPVLDHIIVGGSSHCSLRERGDLD